MDLDLKEDTLFIFLKKKNYHKQWDLNFRSHLKEHICKSNVISIMLVSMSTSPMEKKSKFFITIPLIATSSVSLKVFHISVT